MTRAISDNNTNEILQIGPYVDHLKWGGPRLYPNYSQEHLGEFILVPSHIYIFAILLFKHRKLNIKKEKTPRQKQTAVDWDTGNKTF